MSVLQKFQDEIERLRVDSSKQKFPNIDEKNTDNKPDVGLTKSKKTVTGVHKDGVTIERPGKPSKDKEASVGTNFDQTPDTAGVTDVEQEIQVCLLCRLWLSLCSFRADPPLNRCRGSIQ